MITLDKTKQHYFASCAYGWATGVDLADVKRKLRSTLRRGITIKAVVKVVHLPEASNYTINFGLPVIDNDKLTHIGTMKIRG